MRNIENNYFRVLYITCPNIQEAEKIARILVNNKVAACVNIVPNIKSIYYWQEKVEESNEVLLIIKTIEENLEKLEEIVKNYHSYTVPEIISWSIKSGNVEYLQWMIDTTSVHS